MKGGLDEIVIESGRQKLKAQAEVEIEVMTDLLAAKRMVEDARQKLERNLSTPENVNGCLMGELDEYIERFDPKIVRLEERLAKNRDVI